MPCWLFTTEPTRVSRGVSGVGGGGEDLIGSGGGATATACVGARRDGLKRGRSRVTDRAERGIAQSGLPRGVASSGSLPAVGRVWELLSVGLGASAD